MPFDSPSYVSSWTWAEGLALFQHFFSAKGRSRTSESVPDDDFGRVDLRKRSTDVVSVSVRKGNILGDAAVSAGMSVLVLARLKARNIVRWEMTVVVGPFAGCEVDTRIWLVQEIAQRQL